MVKMRLTVILLSLVWALQYPDTAYVLIALLGVAAMVQAVIHSRRASAAQRNEAENLEILFNLYSAEHADTRAVPCEERLRELALSAPRTTAR